MTVKELIEELRMYPDEFNVLVQGEFYTEHITGMYTTDGTNVIIELQ